jgi:hypothetical protein
MIATMAASMALWQSMWVDRPIRPYGDAHHRINAADASTSHGYDAPPLHRRHPRRARASDARRYARDAGAIPASPIDDTRPRMDTSQTCRVGRDGLAYANVIAPDPAGFACRTRHNAASPLPLRWERPALSVVEGGRG